jgi:hypothetical protein
MDLSSAPFWNDLVAARDELSLVALAKRFDVTPGAIARAFVERGIAKVPHPAQSPEDDVSDDEPRAWEVWLRGDTRPRVVFAASFEKALVGAMARGEVRSVVLLGPAL